MHKLRRGTGGAGWAGHTTLRAGSQDVLLNHTSDLHRFIPGHFDARSVYAADSGGGWHAAWSCGRVREKIRGNGRAEETAAPFFTFNGHSKSDSTISINTIY